MTSRSRKKFPVRVSETERVKITLPCFKSLTAADLSPKDDFDQLFNFQGPVISQCTISACSSSHVARSHLTGSSAHVTSGTAPHAYVATVWLPRQQDEDGVVSISAMDTDDDFGVSMTVKKEGKPLVRGKLLLVLLGIEFTHAPAVYV